MRTHRLVLVSVVAALVVSTGHAQARPRLPGLLGAVFGGVGGLIGLHHYRHHHAVAHAAHHPSRVAARTPEKSTSESKPPSGEEPQSVAAEPPVWPKLPAELADYVFWPSGRGDPFWSFGYADIINGAMRPANAGRHPATARRTETTKTAMASVGAAPSAACVGEQDAQGTEVADSVSARIEQTIMPTQAQQGALAELREALRHGFDYFDAACAVGRAQSPTARLDAMEDRLWAARQALLVIRAPLAKLDATLSDEQKAKFAGQAAQASEREATCPQTTPELPIARLDGGGRPSADQRAGLEALKQTSAGLAKLVADSCPSALPATPVDRLDTADKRLNALLYAVVTLRAPLDGVYASVNAGHKPRVKGSR